MKKLSIMLLLSFFTTFIFAQSENENCITCDSNMVDFTKGASAIGSKNISAGINSLAVGYLNEASGDYSFVTGYQSYCSHQFSAIMGSFDTITNFHSFILGSFSKATGKSSIVVGNDSKSLANYALTIGYHVQSRASEAFTIGAGIVDNPLINNSSRSLIVGFNSNLPTFIVDRAPGVNKTGKIGIGNITSPTAKLHIKADINEDASIMLQPTGSAFSAKIFLGDNYHSIAAREQDDMKFNSGTGNNFIFEDGRVQVKAGDIFIEDIDRGIIMKSPDGNCWRGTVNNNGMLEFVQVDCQTLETDIENPKPSSAERVKIYPNPIGNAVTVEISAEHAGALLSIKSSEGKELVSSRLNNNRNTINLGSYPAGFYFFYISLDGNLLEVKKVVKE